MTYTKIFPIRRTVKTAINYIADKEKTDITRAINYITNADKTMYPDADIDSLLDEVHDEAVRSDHGDLLVSSFGTSVETMHLTIDANQKHWGNPNKTVIARHMIQSFAPGTVTPEQCHQIGLEFIRRLLHDEHIYVMATHVDRDHIHNHFIFDNVNFKTGKCYKSNKWTYRNEIRRISDELSKEYGIPLIEEEKENETGCPPENKSAPPSALLQLQALVEIAILSSKNWEEFVATLTKYGYEVNDKKEPSYRKNDHKTAIRLGRRMPGYTKAEIIERLQKTEEEKQILLPQDPLLLEQIENLLTENIKPSPQKKKYSKQKILAAIIELGILNTSTWEEFVAFMFANGYQVGQGKYLSFLPRGEGRAIRIGRADPSYSKEIVLKRLQLIPEEKEKVWKSKSEQLYPIFQSLSEPPSPEEAASRNKPIRKTYVKSNRTILRESIDKLLPLCSGWDDLLSQLSIHGYQIKLGKYIAVKTNQMQRYMRLRSLGSSYTEESLRKTIEVLNEKKNNQFIASANKKAKMGSQRIISIVGLDDQKNTSAYKTWARNHNLVAITEAWSQLSKLGIQSLESSAELSAQLEEEIQRSKFEISHMRSELEADEKIRISIESILTHRDIYIRYCEASLEEREVIEKKYGEELLIYQNAQDLLKSYAIEPSKEMLNIINDRLLHRRSLIKSKQEDQQRNIEKKALCDRVFAQYQAFERDSLLTMESSVDLSNNQENTEQEKESIKKSNRERL